MQHWIIDDQGDVWPALSERLRQKLYAPALSANYISYLVTDLGYVSVRRTQGGTEVRWRPTFVKQATLVALTLLLEDEVVGRVVVSSLDHEWRQTLHANRTIALDHILGIFETAHCDRGGYFRSEAGRIESLTESPLRRVALVARQVDYKFDPVSLCNLVDMCSQRRFILTEPLEGRLRVVSWSQGYQTFTRDWVSTAAGRDFEDQPDAAYARQAMRGYWQVNEAGVPLLENVRASVWWPKRGRTEVKYTRLVMPIHLTGNRALVLSTVQPLELT